MNNNLSKWREFIKEISNLIFFWFFGILFFFFYRAIFITIYHQELGANVPFSDFWNAFLTGFRFDCTATSYFVLIPLVSTLLLSAFGLFKVIKAIRITCQYLFVILSTLICQITINFYREYNEQFNNFLFMGIFEEDKKAITKTILDYFNPVLNISILIITILVSLWIFKHFEKKTFIYNALVKVKNKVGRVAIILLVLLGFVCSIRGTIGRTPMIRKWSASTTNTFLNKVIINPFRMIKYAHDDYKELSGIGGDNPFGEVDLKELYGCDSVSDVIEKKAKGAKIEKPKQIFLVIMESYDSWPLMDKYRPLNVSKNLSRIADNGMHFANFLPSFNATFYAYGTVTSGIPYCGMNISQIATHQETFICSIFTQFKKLGYKTNMFYGGFLSWGNIGSYTNHLACDKIYSGADAGGKSDSGDWGIEDEKIFDLMLEKIDPEEYTFNLVLTSSYHAPYTVDIYNKGFMYKSADDLPEDMKQYYDGGMSMLELGHLWYGDWAIGRFMDQAETKYKDAIFGFTGDHYGRRFINHAPNLYERSSVPFILYGKDIPTAKPKTPGSHTDIIPTLIELVAPEGFSYHSLGKSLFDEDKKYGIGFEKIIDSTALYFMPKAMPIERIDLDTFEETKQESLEYQEEYNKLMQLSWHYIVNGKALSKEKK